MKNSILRFINSAVCEPMNESQLQESEKRIDIIRNNQKYTGLEDYPKIAESIKYASESLLSTAENKHSCLANIISGLTTTRSLLDISIEKLREEYMIEGEKIKEIISNS